MYIGISSYNAVVFLLLCCSRRQKNTTFCCKARDCGFKSTVLAKFRAHCTDEHQGALSHECFTCGSVFADVQALLRHLEAGVVRLIGCPHCRVICKVNNTPSGLGVATCNVLSSCVWSVYKFVTLDAEIKL